MDTLHSTLFGRELTGQKLIHTVGEYICSFQDSVGFDFLPTVYLYHVLQYYTQSVLPQI